MQRNNVRLSTIRGISLALSNIACGNGYDGYATVSELLDTIEDSIDADDLLRRVGKLNLLGFYQPSIDRETDTYVRIRGIDSLRNIHQLTVQK